MANQKVVEYLEQNKDKFEQDALVAKLKSFGYPQVIIQEAIEEVYGRKAGSVTNVASFFDFKSKKVYLTGREKSLDFISGLFGTRIFIWMLAVLLPLIVITIFWRYF